MNLMKKLGVASLVGVTLVTSSFCSADNLNVEKDNIELFSYPLSRTRVAGANSFEKTIYPNSSEKYYKMWYENNSQYTVTIGLCMNGNRVRYMNIGPYQSDGLVGDFTVQHKKYYNQDFQYKISSQGGQILDGYATFRTENYVMNK